MKHQICSQLRLESIGVVCFIQDTDPTASANAEPEANTDVDTSNPSATASGTQNAGPSAADSTVTNQPVPP